MNEDTARTWARTDNRRRTWLGTRSERLPLLIIGLILAITPVLGATAFAGSGGTGTDTRSDGDGDGKYKKLWNGLSEKQQRWAKRTSRCESGNDPKIHGGGGTYHGAFQFMKSTWKSAPKSPGGDPHTYNWRTQAVVAVYLKKRDGAGHWPNCG